MRERLFATPLDGATIAVRRAPATPLHVIPAGTNGAWVQVALAESEQPLDVAEFRAMTRYFDGAGGSVLPYWWSTQVPARFRLEQLRGRTDAAGRPSGDALFRGVLEARGRVAHHLEPPDARPGVRPEARLFRVHVPPGPDRQLVERDPRVRPLRQVYRSEAVVGWLAEVPEHGPGHLWLRVPAFDGAACEAAFASEASVLRHLAVVRPENAVGGVHTGFVQVEGGRQPYIATAAPLGAELTRWLRAAPAGEATGWCRDAAGDLLHALAAAHEGGWCIGPFGPPLLWARPGLHHTPSVLRTVFAAAPMSGREGEAVREADRARAPRWESTVTYGRRSPLNDLRSLGELLSHHLRPWIPADDPLAGLARELSAGRLPSANEALAHLNDSAPRGTGDGSDAPPPRFT
jgi:hypothetical protein